MRATSKSFLGLNAADLMSHTVVTVPQDMSLQAAARMLSQSHVSGAPVIDALGRCVGVLSATDFMHWAENGPDMAMRGRAAARCVCEPWQIVDADELPLDDVRHHMTTDLVAVGPDAGIAELARKMIDAHIHRVIVVDELGRPIGVVSSTDILAAVANMALAHRTEGRPIPAVHA
jgi:CBS-domain-containing membrane protein